MSEQATSLPVGPRVVHVQAQADHIQSLTRGKPVNALAELVWNALDADADRIRIGVTDNEIGSPSTIEVSDNGSGISPADAERAFGNLGGSWKREHRLTQRTNKKMHGRDGKGRFKAFALGALVEWDTVFLGDDDKALRYVIKGSIDRLQDFEVGAPEAAPPGRGRGTRVRISAIQEPLGVLSRDGAAATHLAELFALYLRNYPKTDIVYRGERINPKAVQKAHTTRELPSFVTDAGVAVEAHLDIVEWTFSKKERRICLCDSDGFALQEVEAGIRPGGEFNFTAYIRSEYIAQLQQTNALVDELDPSVRRLVEDARSALRGHFRRRKAESAAELVKQWKAEGVYPFAGDACGAVEIARREVFDICALNVHQHLDSFREGPVKDRQFTLRMLKVALDENPESLKRILTDVLELSKERQSEFAELLQFTTLSSIIEASKLVADRLQFLQGLHELLFRPDAKLEVKERSQLHRMLEKETWVFGEEYLLTSSDENLNTVLAQHLATLRPELAKGRKSKQKPVVRDDGSQGVIDLMLAREVPAYAQTRREFLVVELKRPSQKINLDVHHQILSYALAVAADERFDKKDTHWTFIAVSNEMTDDAQETISQEGKPYGFFHEKGNVRVGLATWAEILGASRARLEAFRRTLDYTATKDQGIANLHRKYAQYLPENLSSAAEADPKAAG